MNKLYQRLQDIKQNPETYLGEKSLDRLDQFLFGYALCENDYDVTKKEMFKGFDDFVREKYGNTTHAAVRLVNFYSATKEEAFYKYIELLEEYLAMHPENLE